LAGAQTQGHRSTRLHSPFYKKRFQEADITPDKIRSLDDIKKLPFLTKEDLRKDQEAHPPWGSMLAVPLEETQRVHMTSGTTGTPIKILDTAADWSNFCHI
jgi:phenylacetate-CoA ligase